MPPLNIELHDSKKDTWTSVGQIKFGDPDGTISDNHKDGRDIYLFGVDPVENQGYIKRSAGGIDIAEGNTRTVDSLGFVAIAELDPNQSYELTVKTDISSMPRRIKFTYIEE
jgi:hypothetical protein